MEKFYIVTIQSKLHKDYFDYLENSERVSDVAKEILDEFQIESHLFSPSSDALYIVPTDNYRENFKMHLCKEQDGLCKLKVSSNINKSWRTKLKEKGLKVQYRPFVDSYFRSNGSGKFRYRLFDHKDVLYCSFEREGNVNNIKTPEGFIEIKGSEFYLLTEGDE